MIVKYNDKIYNIEELSYKSEYFEILKSGNFSENINEILDLSHREKEMECFLDMLTLKEFWFSFYELVDFDVLLLLLDEFCVKYPYQKHYYDKIILTKKEGYYCHDCKRLNNWLMPYGDYHEGNDWEIQRLFCNCSYTRDTFGYRISWEEHYKEYYSYDGNCKHMSSIW